jgi:homoserine dehydrogenase
MTEPTPRTEALDVEREVVAAAVEWVNAHDALMEPSASSMTDPELLERYSDAATELLAVVSQNRDRLAAKETP